MRSLAQIIRSNKELAKLQVGPLAEPDPEIYIDPAEPEIYIDPAEPEIGLEA